MTAEMAATALPLHALPDGPRLPVPLQTLAMRARQRPFLERARRRYGPLMSIRVLGLGRPVVVSDPELIKHVFRADPAVLHAGTGSPLRQLLGRHSLLGIDEDEHLEQRRPMGVPRRRVGAGTRRPGQDPSPLSVGSLRAAPHQVRARGVHLPPWTALPPSWASTRTWPATAGPG